jgi:two-component system response regulator RstA
VLIVEDDHRLGALVLEYLTQNGLDASLERDGGRAVARVLAERPDVLVLDLMLPGEDGLSICRKVRPAFTGAILMLTARGEELDQVLGLELGADDYLVKPASMRILLARIRALLRRDARPAESDSERVELGPLVVDRRTREVLLSGAPIVMTTAEFDLLWELARNAGRTVSRQDLMKSLRGIDYDGLDRSMDVRVLKLRQKLGDDPDEPRWIKSVRGVGYLLAWAAED